MYLLSIRADRQGCGYIGYCLCVCVCVRLRISPPRTKLAASNFAAVDVNLSLLVENRPLLICLLTYLLWPFVCGGSVVHHMGQLCSDLLQFTRRVYTNATALSVEAALPLISTATFTIKAQTTYQTDRVTDIIFPPRRTWTPFAKATDKKLPGGAKTPFPRAELDRICNCWTVSFFIVCFHVCLSLCVFMSLFYYVRFSFLFFMCVWFIVMFSLLHVRLLRAVININQSINQSTPSTNILQVSI